MFEILEILKYVKSFQLFEKFEYFEYSKKLPAAAARKSLISPSKLPTARSKTPSPTQSTTRGDACRPTSMPAKGTGAADHQLQAPVPCCQPELVAPT